MIERRDVRMFQKYHSVLSPLLIILGFLITWVVWISKIPAVCNEVAKQGEKIEMVQMKTNILEERLINMDKNLTKIEINIDKLVNKYAR